MQRVKQFYTSENRRVPAVTTAQMIEIDRIAMQETGPNLFQMMENAGRTLALLAMHTMGERCQDAKYIILAGSGGNGGGICAGRHLANRWLDVSCCFIFPDRLTDVAAWQRHVFLNAGGQEISFLKLKRLKPDIILDAVFGYNLNAAPYSPALDLIQWANQSDALKMSLDVPSGVDATTGECPGEYCHADRTLTLALPKTGLLPSITGDLYLADIGIPAVVYEKIKISYASPFGTEFYVPLTRAKLH